MAERVRTEGDKLKDVGQDKTLEIYALFKQATTGDVNIDRPGMLDPKGKAKWDAWSAKKGISQEDARTMYIDLTTSLLE